MPAPRPYCASAPGRAGLLGNPTDGYGGCVLNCTVPFRARAEFTPGTTPGLLAVFGDREADLGDPAAWAPAGDDLDVVRSVLRYLNPDVPPRGQLHVETDVPRQAGLGGSTALLAAVLGVLDPDRVEAGPPELTAERLRIVERHFLGVTCGFHDQYNIVRGGLNFMDFAGKAGQGSVPPDPYARVEPLPDPPDTQLPFLVAHTGQVHESGTVHTPLRARWEAGDPEVVTGYARIAELCRQGRVCFQQGDWKTMGRLMDENHAIQRDLGGSGEANEALIAEAKRAGAFGAKLAGAGRGGTIIAVHEDLGALRRVLETAGAATVFALRRERGLDVYRDGAR